MLIKDQSVELTNVNLPASEFVGNAAATTIAVIVALPFAAAIGAFTAAKNCAVNLNK